jgi:Nickel responsive protein SCO4226-like
VPRYIIVRSFDVGEPEMPGVGRRSREIVETELPEITWEHSHVVVDEETGKVRTFCIYAAPSEEIVRAHSSRLGQHKIDSIDEIVGDVTPADFPPV